MVLLSVTAETWIVTGLGFGIVLVLLFCLVFIIQGLGWVMQRLTAPKQPKAAAQPAPVQTAAPAPAAAVSKNDDVHAAIAMALYLSREERHDLPNARLYLQAHETAWNAKEIGLNNKGF
ncbi:MAG: OadG family protein [Paludibacteraceae bacterium]|nr:OadG family protein [Paludibacteraceae bacterium]